jgi:putative hemolysin
MSELAIVSARPARLRLLADKGCKGAGIAIRLAADPGRFLSSVQIGITLVGILAGAFSGATLGACLAASLIDAGMQRLHDLSRSRLPVWEGDVDNIIGVLATRDILAPALMNESFDLRALLRDAPVVRDGQSALEVVDRLRTSPAHMVLVYDEHGHFEGIITPMDVLVAITGEFPESETDEPKVVTRADGSYLVAGWMPVDEFADLLSLEIDADRDFETSRLSQVLFSTG